MMGAGELTVVLGLSGIAALIIYWLVGRVPS
jgi:hypothetical protein